MSVLIRGMEMPTSCNECRMSNGIYCYAALERRERDEVTVYQLQKL